MRCSAARLVPGLWAGLIVALVSACAPSAPELPARERPSALELAAQFVAPKPPPDARAEDRFGGISGLAPLNGGDILAVSDDREDSRVYRLRVEWTAGAMHVRRLAAFRLQRGGGAPATLDPEGIAVTREGHILVASEGVGNREPRLAPAIIEYSPDGSYIRALPVRRRFAPTERGPIVRGVRDNAGFESLTVTPDHARLFTATELPLAQDGDLDPFAAGARSRILEYAAAGGTYEPAREFVYELDGLGRLGFTARFAINGVVELLALGGDDLLVLERGFAESLDRAESINRIRLFRVSLAGASDVSALDSLRGARGITPVRKTLLLDLNTVPGLDPRLAGLDNFEGMAWGPPLAGTGRRSLLLVSDDNFSARQVTAFLALSADGLAEAPVFPRARR